MVEIYVENCLDTMARFEDDCIDLVVTSPPYDNLRQYKGYSFDFESVANALWRVIKPGGIVVWIVNDSTINGSESGTSFKQALFFKSIGFRLHDTMIFAKENPVPLTHNRYEQQFEYMFILSKGKPKTFNPILKANKKAGKMREGKYYKTADSQLTSAGNTPGIIANESIANNIWFYYVGNRGLQKLGIKHPAMFPLDLAKDHIASWSNDGDLVYDPFLGSGTTGLAAKKLNRKFIGSEISAEYAETAIERINNG